MKQRLIQMLHDYVEIFAWSYEDMPGLDTDIVVHRLPTVIGGSGTDCLTLVREMSRKQESPPSFIFSKWKGQKHRKIP